MKIILENTDDIDNYLCIFYTLTCKVKPDSRAPQEHSTQTAHLLGRQKNGANASKIRTQPNTTKHNQTQPDTNTRAESQLLLPSTYSVKVVTLRSLLVNKLFSKKNN
jgi:hypothetical protein